MINYLEHHIVDHCNLNCDGCSHFSPLANEGFEDIEDFHQDFSVLSLKTQGNVGCIRLMGGEPLLHPQYDEFLRCARILFPHSNIQIVTNGILLKKEHDKLVNICNEYDIQVCTSDYRLNLNLQELLKDFKYTRIDNKNNLYNICLNLEGTYNNQTAFNNCDLHINHWYYFQYGAFYPCCIAANLHYFNEYFNLNIPNNEKSISIYDYNIKEIEEFLNKPIPLCKYCNTILRQNMYHPFKISQKEIKEWICQ